MKNRIPRLKRATAGLSFLRVTLGLALGWSHASAGSATWLSIPSNGDWNAAANWTPGGPPNGVADSATFEVSSLTAISLSANTEVSSIEFSPGASAYTITASPGLALRISGPGIVNDSGQIQNFVTVGAGSTVGTLIFANSATAGVLTSLTNRGGASTAGFGGMTQFLNDSNAGQATITNEGGTVFAAQSGFTQFSDNSSAADSTVVNTGGAADGAFGGLTFFLGTSTAGQAHFSNEAGLVSGAGIGLTQFSANSTAGGGTFTNQGATGEGEPGGATIFRDNATAANGSFFNRGGQGVLGHGGATLFFGSATAGNATFISFGGEHGGAFGGETNFLGNSSAATATFINRSGEVFASSGGFTQFFDNSTAADAVFTNEGGTESGNNRGFGFMNFFDNSTAGRARFVTNGGTVSGALGGSVLFLDNSSAGEGTFTTNGGLMVGAGGGNIGFDNNATAANGTFTTNGGMGIGAPGAEMSFFGSSTAGNGNFTINGGAVGAASGGRTNFFSNSTAATGTFVLNGGAAPGASGGFVKFWDDSTAGDAVFVVNGGTVPKIITPAGTGNGGVIQFIDNATSGNGIFINNGGAVSGASGGLITFESMGSLGNSTFINNGGAVPGAEGGLFRYSGQDGGSATLIANGGPDGAGGGSILFFENAEAPGARIQVFSNGSLDISPRNPPGTTIGSLEGSGLVFLGRNTLTVGGNNLDTLFSGVVQDGGLRGGTNGSLRKIGAGTLVLSGTSSYGGPTHIDGGALLVNGSIASPTSFVSPAGLLGGTGFIGGNVFSSGSVSPGEAGPGRLSLGGSYVQDNSGTLRIEIGGLALVQHDLLQMSGAAQLDGRLQLLRLNNFRFLPGDKVTFLTSTGGVSGSFSTVTNPFNDTIVLTRVVYEANQVSLAAVQGSFASLTGLTPNQRAVADNLDVVAAGSPGDELIAFLNTELLANLPGDFDLIAAEELASIYETGFSQVRMQSLNLQRRMEQIRNGSTGFSASGFNLRGNRQISNDGKTSASSEKPAPLFDTSPENRWGVFVAGAGEYVNVGNDLNARGYDIRTGGITLGLDFRPASNFALGVHAGYAHSSTALINDGSVTVEGGKIGAYATYFSGGFYADSAIGAGWNTYDTRRRALQANVGGETDGAQFQAMAGAGYEWKHGNWRFGPAATFQYSDVRMNSFQEGRSLGALRIPEQSAGAFQSTLGFNVSSEWKTCGVILRPELRAGWQHEYGDRAHPIAASFASGAGDVFTVRGPAVDRDRAVIGAGMTVQWSSRVSSSLYYQGQLGRNYHAHGAGGGISFSF